MNDRPRTEREEVAQIYARQDELTRAVIQKVLSIERTRLHLAPQRKATIDLLLNAIREEVK